MCYAKISNKQHVRIPKKWTLICWSAAITATGSPIFVLDFWDFINTRSLFGHKNRLFLSVFCFIFHSDMHWDYNLTNDTRDILKGHKNGICMTPTHINAIQLFIKHCSTAPCLSCNLFRINEFEFALFSECGYQFWMGAFALAAKIIHANGNDQRGTTAIPFMDGDEEKKTCGRILIEWKLHAQQQSKNERAKETERVRSSGKGVKVASKWFEKWKLCWLTIIFFGICYAMLRMMIAFFFTVFVFDFIHWNTNWRRCCWASIDLGLVIMTMMIRMRLCNLLIEIVIHLGRCFSKGNKLLDWRDT